MRALALGAILVAALATPAPAVACGTIPVGPNTPTGIAGCVRWGEGIASWYASGGPGLGVAMNYCTWSVRHRHGCGYVTITSLDTGLTVTAPVVDFCDCYTGTDDERIADLQPNTVLALGLNFSRGLYRVDVQPGAPPTLPDTAMEAP